MKNIFIYIGSQAGNESNTLYLAKSILDIVVKKTGHSVRYDLYTPANTNINKCRSCNNCYSKGICILDQENKDDMRMIKEKMIEADFIIWGSPVYAHNVSGDMKIFIDRISYWTHLIRLVGKPSLSLSTAYSNGGMSVCNYLSRIMSQLGLKVVGKLNAYVYYPNELRNKEFMEKETSKFAEIICDYILYNKKIETDETLEAIFQVFKKVMTSLEQYPNAEYKFWLENGYFDCNSFKDLLDLKCKY